MIYGDSGLGKTHLLNSIANVIRRDDSRSKIVYIKGDDFINEFIELIRAGRGSEFRAKYRSADLLLVDDVQFVAKNTCKTSSSTPSTPCMSPAVRSF